MGYMRTNYLPGKYKLTKIEHCSGPHMDEIEVDVFAKLTSAEAKMMFKLYEKLGFDRIEFCDNVNE